MGNGTVLGTPWGHWAHGAMEETRTIGAGRVAWPDQARYPELPSSHGTADRHVEESAVGSVSSVPLHRDIVTLRSGQRHAE